MNATSQNLEAGQRALQQGDAPAALAAAEQVLAEQPDALDALVLAGQALYALDQPAVAVKMLERARQQAPKHPGLLSNLAALRLALGEPGPARDLARQAAALAPGHFGVQLNLGLASLALREYEAAERALQAALDLEPGHAPALRGLAKAQYRAGRAHRSARPLLEQASALFPEDHELRALLADSFVQTGEITDGLAAYRALLNGAERIPAADRARYHSAYLLAMLYDPETTPEELLQAHRGWAADLPPAEPLTPVANTGQRLRIGWLSPRFGDGPLASFLLPVLAAFDRERSEHYLYAAYPQHGPLNQRFRDLADHWCALDGLESAAAAQRIADDRLDVLVDLAGHAPGGQLLALRHRPAPVQLSWLDAFCTTGLPEVDGFISDAALTPEQDERWYTERVLRLEAGRMCYRPQQVVAEPRAGHGEQLVFACFNRLSKLNDAVLMAWARILKAVPDGRLRLRNSLFEDPQVRRDLLQRCAQAGLDPERVSLHGYCSYAEIMAEYDEVDIALDPFPFSGCTTTCDALWMGVPVITRTGATLVSRQSGAILERLGYSDWVTDSDAGYVAAAVALARDNRGRAGLRGCLRDEMRQAFVPAGFASELLKLFEDLSGQA